MKMKVISALNNKEIKNAGPKAPKDINEILESNFNSKSVTIVKDKKFKIKVMMEYIKSFFYKGIIVIQHPIIYNYKLYKLLPKKRTIILIHDISGLRNQDNRLLEKEINIFKMFKYIIVHNDVMKEFLKSREIKEENIYTLEIFDYIADKKKENSIENQKHNIIFYPGNLKKEKSPFIYQLDENRMKFSLNLYGVGIEKDINSKILYKGSFKPENISDLYGDIGLVWDGKFDESDENDNFKNYTKYNNPHKLSCCLATGKPVIAWKKSAISGFITKYDIGYLISDIYEINNIDFSNYETKKINAMRVGEKLRKGYYTLKVFNQIIQKI